MKTKIDFEYIDGFAGRTYFVLIADQRYKLCCNAGDLAEAISKAKDLLSERGIDCENIKFDFKPVGVIK